MALVMRSPAGAVRPRPPERARPTRRGQVLVACLAYLATLGLASAHIVTGSAAFPADGDLATLVARVYVPALAELVLAGAALTYLHRRGQALPRRVRTAYAWTACGVLALLAVGTALTSLASNDPAALGFAGPLPWSLAGAPAFGWLARRDR